MKKVNLNRVFEERGIILRKYGKRKQSLSSSRNVIGASDSHLMRQNPTDGIVFSAVVPLHRGFLYTATRLWHTTQDF